MLSRLGWIGVATTAMYIAAISWFQWSQLIAIRELELNAFGDFLAGTFGPLAIFWLVLGFFQQGAELKNSVETLKLQADELGKSVTQQAQLSESSARMLKLESDRIEQEAKRQAYFAYSDVTRGIEKTSKEMRNLTANAHAALSSVGKLNSGHRRQMDAEIDLLNKEMVHLKESVTILDLGISEHTSTETMLENATQLYDLRNQLENYRSQIKLIQDEIFEILESKRHSQFSK